MFKGQRELKALKKGELEPKCTTHSDSVLEKDQVKTRYTVRLSKQIQ